MPGPIELSRSIVALILALASLTLGTSDLVHATPAPTLSQGEEAERLWQQVERIYGVLADGSIPAGTRRESLARLVDASGCSPPAPERLEAAMHRSQAKRHEAEYGLSLNAYASSGTTTVEPSEQTDGYVELSWDVLDGGLLESGHKAEQSRLRARLSDIEAAINKQRRELRCLRGLSHQRFLSKRLQWLTLKYDLMRLAYRVERRGYFQGWAHLDELMVSESDLVNLRMELETSHNLLGLDHPALAQPPLDAPIVDIDLQAVLAAIKNDQHLTKLKAVQRSLVREKETKYENRLRLFLRQSIDSNAKTDISVGARFSMPLAMGGEARRNALRQERQAAVERVELRRWERATSARSAYLDFQEQLDRTIGQHYRVSRAWERLRRSIASLRLDPQKAKLPLAVTRARALAEAKLEMVTAKESLYRRLFEVFQAAGIRLSAAALTTVRLPAPTDRRRFGSRLAYVWSDSLNHLPNGLLLDFLLAKGVNHAAVSGGVGSDRAQLRDFTRRAEQRGITVAVLRGSPKWARPSTHDRVVPLLRHAADLTGRIHLDIEPHLLPEYETDKRHLLSGLLSLLERLRLETGPDTYIAVSVPTHWPKDIYERLAPMVDEVVIMAYGMTNSEKLTKRLAPPLSALPAPKTRIALRPSDFDDEWQLERFIEELAVRTGTNRFALHDLESYMDLGSVTE